jgi:glycosyltransferase involved in cell wall biosynthesis
MTKSTPLLSICVPTYNRRVMLERNIQFHLEAFRRLGVAFELVIVDDRSTDGTHEYLESLSNEPEISHYRRVKNSGFLSNYAFAMQQAKGQYALFLGDDDLLIPEKVVEYLGLMQDDPDLGMIQAPWMLVNERDGGVDMRPFYHIPWSKRVRRGDFRELLEFILEYHVFPEFLIIRRDVLQQSISSPGPFIFWAFLYTTRALGKADVMFLPAPFARVTGVSASADVQQGNKECMFQWDTYLGGLEYLASHAGLATDVLPMDRGPLYQRMLKFMVLRKSVALKLHIASRNWIEAYIMYHRISAYHPNPLPPASFKQICTLAAIITGLMEASSYSGGSVVVDPAIGDDALQLVPEKLRACIVRQPAKGADGPLAWLSIRKEFAAGAASGDRVFELSHYQAQFT